MAESIQLLTTSSSACWSRSRSLADSMFIKRIFVHELAKCTRRLLAHNSVYLKTDVMFLQKLLESERFVCMLQIIRSKGSYFILFFGPVSWNGRPVKQRNKNKTFLLYYIFNPHVRTSARACTSTLPCTCSNTSASEYLSGKVCRMKERKTFPVRLTLAVSCNKHFLTNKLVKPYPGFAPPTLSLPSPRIKNPPSPLASDDVLELQLPCASHTTTITITTGCCGDVSVDAMHVQRVNVAPLRQCLLWEPWRHGARAFSMTPCTFTSLLQQPRSGRGRHPCTGTGAWCGEKVMCNENKRQLGEQGGAPGCCVSSVVLRASWALGLRFVNLSRAGRQPLPLLCRDVAARLHGNPSPAYLRGKHLFGFHTDRDLKGQVGREELALFVWEREGGGSALEIQQLVLYILCMNNGETMVFEPRDSCCA